jgi:hypothetical protein
MSENQIPRLMTADKYSELLSMATMLYSFRAPTLSEAILVFPSLGTTEHITEAINLWEFGNKLKIGRHHSRYLLIAGHHPSEDIYYEDLSLEKLQEDPYQLSHLDGVISIPHAQHTAEQALWVVEQVKERNIQSISLIVPAFHLLRAYCTVLKAFINTHTPPIPIYPRPANIAPSALIPPGDRCGWNMIAGEMERIFTYQEKGDVATFEEFQAYMDWLWNPSG